MKSFLRRGGAFRLSPNWRKPQQSPSTPPLHFRNTPPHYHSFNISCQQQYCCPFYHHSHQSYHQSYHSNNNSHSISTGDNNENSSFANNIQQKYSDLTQSILRIWSTDSPQQAHMNFASTLQLFTEILQNLDERLFTCDHIQIPKYKIAQMNQFFEAPKFDDRSTVNLPPFQRNYHKISMESMLLLELYAQFLESYSLSQVDLTSMVLSPLSSPTQASSHSSSSLPFDRNMLNDEQWSLLQKSFMQRHSVYKIFRLVDCWFQTFDDVKMIQLDFENEFAHVRIWERLQSRFITRQFPAFVNPHGKSSVLNILLLNSARYGFNLGVKAMNHQLLSLAISVFETVLGDMKYMPLDRYQRYLKEKRLHGEEKNENYNEKMDCFAIMAMVRLAACYQTVGRYGDARLQLDTAHQMTQSYLTNDGASLCAQHTTIRHMKRHLEIVHEQVQFLNEEEEETQRENNPVGSLPSFFQSTSTVK